MPTLTFNEAEKPTQARLQDLLVALKESCSIDHAVQILYHKCANSTEAAYSLRMRYPDAHPSDLALAVLSRFQ